MSMTLKVASHFDEIGSQPTPTHWIGGVETASRIRSLAEGENPEMDLATVVDLRASIDMPSTLISVVFPGPDLSYFVVERAWLLSENGATLERIAPY